MPFRSHQQALAYSVEKLRDDVVDRDREISSLRSELRRDSRAPVDREQRLRTLVIALTGVAIVLMVVAAAVWRLPSEPTTRSVARWAMPHSPPDRAAPLLVDVNGDGLEEVVGRFEGYSPPGRYVGLFQVAAADATDHQLRWRLGPYTTLTEPQHLAVSDGRMLLVDGRHAAIHDLVRGTQLADVDLPGEVVSVCQSPARQGPVWLLMAGDDHQLLDLQRATLEPAPRPGWCRNRGVSSAPAIAGFTTEVAMVEGSHMVALAKRLEGSGEAVLLGFQKGDPRTRWQRPLASDVVNPLGRTPRPGQQAVLHDGHLFVAFHDAGSNTNHLEAIDASTGTTLWTTVLPLDPSDDVRAIAAGRRYLYVAHGSWLSVFTVAGGKLVEVLGEPPRG